MIRWSRSAGGARVVVFPAVSRGTIHQSCPRDVMRRFLDAPDAPLDSGCIARMLPIRFVVLE